MEFTNVYVKNFRGDVDEQGLRDLFSQFGVHVPQGNWGSLSLLLPGGVGRRGFPEAP